MTRLFTTIADMIWANPTVVGRYLRYAPARAATPSEPSLLRVSGKAGIAIAAFAISVFAAPLVSWSAQ
jgi:hypothetical protein